VDLRSNGHYYSRASHGCGGDATIPLPRRAKSAAGPVQTPEEDRLRVAFSAGTARLPRGVANGKKAMRPTQFN